MYCDLKINRKIKTAIVVMVLIALVFGLAVSIVHATSAGWVTGKFSKAYDFNGQNYIDIGDVYNGVKTVAFWVNGTGAGAVLNLNDTVYVSISSSTVTTTGFTSPTIYIDGAVGSTVDTNWHFVAITDTTAINASAVKFGSLTASNLTGVMDDVKMFNYALSAREINEKYRQGAPSLAQGGTASGDLYIMNSGKLGIGTTTASSLLTVVGDSYFTGNIGIGTSTPYTKLDVWGSFQVGTSTTPTLTPLFIANTGTATVGIGTSTPASKFAIVGTAGVNSLNVASSTGSSMLMVDQYGNLGIGTSSPVAKFAVEGNTFLRGNATTTGDLFVGGSATTTNLYVSNILTAGYLNILGTTTLAANLVPATTNTYNVGTANYRWNEGWFNTLNIGTSTWSINQPDNQRLSFWNSASGTGVEKLTITQAGWLGISTSSPSALLAITGTSSVASLQISSSTGAMDFMVGQYGNVGIGTSTPSARLDMLSRAGWSSLHIASSTGANMLSINEYGLVSFGLPDNQSTAMTVSEGSNTYLTFDTTDGVEKIVVGKNLEIGPMNVDADSSEVDFVNMTVSTTTATSTIESLSIAIDGNSILTIYGEADGQGNLINYRVGIGTTSPTAMLDIRGNVSTSGALLRVSTSTTEALSIDALGYVGLGTTSPATKLDIYGVGTQLRISTTSGYANFYVDNNGYLNMETQYSTTSALQITNSNIIANQPMQFNSPGDVGFAYDLSMENPSAAYIRFSGAGYVQTESPFGNNNLTLSAANAGQVVINDNMQITGQTQFVATTTQTVSTTTAIVVGDATYITVTATSSVILSSAPTIADGVNGQVVILKGASTTATVSLQDQGTLGNSNLQLGATPRQLGNGDTLALMFDGTDWVELWFSADINADYAEMYKIKEDVGFGEVVSLDKDNYLQVKKAVLGEKDVAGIISAQPAYLIGQEFRDEMQLPVALAGRVPVKISLEAGEIKKGDILVPSTKPGYAMRYNEEYLKQVSASSSLDLSNVPIVGISLENYGAPSAAGEFLETTYKTYKVKFKEGSDSADINLLNGKYKVKVLPSPNSPSRNIDISTSPQEQTIEIRAGYADKYLQASVMESSQWLSDNIIRQPNPEFRPANSNNETALCMVRSGYVRVGPSSGFSKLTVIEKDGQLSFEPEDKNFAEALDMVIEADGSLVVGKLKAKQAEIGSTEKPAGITLYDEETGAPYCLKIKAGAMISEAGKCGENGKEGGSLLPAGRSEPPSDDTPVVSEPPAASTDSLSTPSVDSATTTPVIPSEPQASEEFQPPAPETPPAEQPAD